MKRKPWEERRPPFRCYVLGRHAWRFVSMSDSRTIDVSGQGVQFVCSLVERCQRCDLRRTTDAAPIPKRVRPYRRPVSRSVTARTVVWRLAAGPLLLVAVVVVGALAGAALAAFLTWAVAS